MLACFSLNISQSPDTHTIAAHRGPINRDWMKLPQSVRVVSQPKINRVEGGIPQGLLKKSSTYSPCHCDIPGLEEGKQGASTGWHALSGGWLGGVQRARGQSKVTGIQDSALPSPLPPCQHALARGYPRWETAQGASQRLFANGEGETTSAQTNDLPVISWNQSNVQSMHLVSWGSGCWTASYNWAKGQVGVWICLDAGQSLHLQMDGDSCLRLL